MPVESKDTESVSSQTTHGAEGPSGQEDIRRAARKNRVVVRE